MPKSMFSENYRKVTELITAKRQEQGITQTLLAKRVGKPQSYIAKIEGGERRLDIIEFIALTDAMEVSASEFFEILEKEMVRPISI